MSALVNSVLGGATATLICILGARLPAVASAAIGAVTGIGTIALGLSYEHHRLSPLIRGDALSSGGPS